MTEDEKYVREHWEETICGGLYIYESVRAYHFRLGGWQHKGTVKDKAAIWSAAAEFTRTRLQQVRDVEEEIELLRYHYKDCHDAGMECVSGSDSRKVLAAESMVWMRIIDCREAALANLKRGLRIAE